jgi:hypothetical protein
MGSPSGQGIAAPTTRAQPSTLSATPERGRRSGPGVFAWALPIVAAAVSGVALATGVVSLGIVAGVVLLWSLGAGMWPGRLPQAPLDAAVIPMALGLAVVGLAALVLADLDLFDPAAVWALIAGGAIVLGAVRARRRLPLHLSRGGMAALAALAIVPAAVPVAPWVYGGRDPGLYVLAAEMIHDRGTMIVHDTLGARLPADLRPELTAYPGSRFQGIYPVSAYGNKVVPHGLHLLPATMAAGASLSGGLGLWIVCLGGVLLVLSTARLAQLLSPRQHATVAAIVAGGLLASNAALIYFSRFPMPETLTGGLLLGGSAALAIALTRRSAAAALAAGGILGASLLAHIDSYPAVLVVAAVAGWAWAVMGARRVAVALAVGVGIPALIAVLHDHYVARFYTTSLIGSYVVDGHHLTLRAVVVFTVGVVVLVGLLSLAVGRLPRVRNFLRAGPGWVAPTVVGVIGGALATGLLILALNNSSESLILIRTYVHSEVLLVGLAGGVAVAVVAAREKRLAVVITPLMLFVAMMIAYGRSPKAALDQYWVARRFLPVQMPVISALAGATIALVLSRLSTRLARRVAVAAAVAATLVIAGFSLNEAKPALSVTEYSGLPRQLNAFNRGLGPPSTLVLAGLGEYTQSRIAPALWLHYGRPTVAVHRADETTASPPKNVDLREPRLSHWILGEARRRPVVLITSQLAERNPIVNAKQLAVRRKASQTFDARLVERAVGRPPNKTFHELATVDVWRISPAARPSAKTGAASGSDCQSQQQPGIDASFGVRRSPAAAQRLIARAARVGFQNLTVQRRSCKRYAAVLVGLSSMAQARDFQQEAAGAGFAVVLECRSQPVRGGLAAVFGHRRSHGGAVVLMRAATASGFQNLQVQQDRCGDWEVDLYGADTAKQRAALRREAAAVGYHLTFEPG